MMILRVKSGFDIQIMGPNKENKMTIKHNLQRQNEKEISYKARIISLSKDFLEMLLVSDSCVIPSFSSADLYFLT